MTILLTLADEEALLAIFEGRSPATETVERVRDLHRRLHERREVRMAFKAKAQKTPAS